MEEWNGEKELRMKVRKKLFPVGFQTAFPLVDMNKQDIFRYVCFVNSKETCRLHVNNYTVNKYILYLWLLYEEQINFHNIHT
jgi:hypothetical protein